MAKYHLHLINAHLDAGDEEGHDLPSLAAARAKAIEGVRDFLASELRQGKLDLRGRIDIEDETGAVLMTIPFADTISILT